MTDEIVAAARELGAELIVMATEGRHGFLDAVRGSTRSVSWGKPATPYWPCPPVDRRKDVAALELETALKAIEQSPQEAVTSV